MIRILSVLLILNMSFGAQVYSQKLEVEEDICNYQIESLLKMMDSYRFGLISIYKLEDIRKVQKAIQIGDDASSSGPANDTTFLVKFDSLYSAGTQEVRDDICLFYKSGEAIDRIIEQIYNKYGTAVPQNDIEGLKKFCGIAEEGGTKIRSGYVITTRGKDENTKGEIIALIVSKTDANNIQDDIDYTDSKFIFTFIELKRILDPENQSQTVYDLLNGYLNQGNVKPMTAEGQGTGLRNTFVPIGPGNTQSLLQAEDNIGANDIAKFMRISEGQPLNYKGGKTNELIISPDLISWKQYPWDEEEDDLEETVVNERLPKYGIELRYGIDDLNMPSFWSERWALNGIWDNAKLGVILPTSGWASAFDGMYNRKFTTAGVGVNGQFDFAFPVIRKSGVFRFSMSYVSGDAEQSEFKIPQNLNSTATDMNFDYLLRAHAQMHYTFGVSVDDNYLFRFSLGGSVYNVEKWNNVIRKEANDFGDSVSKRDFKYYNDNTYGGISGKIDFMTNFRKKTPYGASIQYFNETIGLHGWIQIPIIDNTFSIKLDVNSYFSLRNDDMDLYFWELGNKSLVIPMIRFVYVF